ncbi:hypothetical protein BaRGS_00026181 [Batillaria attramentaria]|uniref:Cadherin domain-containing protein n=1 Tax=Batillaria attramentaria TaxID=370345 RepID=A0ABD0K6Z5_9CAEN
MNRLGKQAQRKKNRDEDKSAEAGRWGSPGRSLCALPVLLVVSLLTTSAQGTAAQSSPSLVCGETGCQQSFSVLENVPVGTVVGTVGSLDAAGVGPPFLGFESYGPGDLDAAGAFNLDLATGRLTTKRALDRETTPEGYRFTVHTSGRQIDLDLGENARIRYSIDSSSDPEGIFGIDPVTGTVTVLKLLDREVRSEYRLIVTATDGGTPPNQGAAAVDIHVQDVNDNPPIFTQHHYAVAVTENVPVGTSILSVKAVDMDRGENCAATLLYRQFLRHRRNLRHRPIRWHHHCAETAGSRSSLGISTCRTSTTTRRCSSAITAPSSLVGQVPVGTDVVVIQAYDADSGENGRIRYSIVQDSDPETHFKIDPDTGLVTVNKPLDYLASSMYVLKVEATDGGTPPLTATTSFEIHVADPGLVG